MRSTIKIIIPLLFMLTALASLMLAGSDAVPVAADNLDALHLEPEHLVRCGFSNLDALQAATINPARLLKVDRRHGSIAVGKRADQVVLNNNPLENIAHSRDIHSGDPKRASCPWPRRPCRRNLRCAHKKPMAANCRLPSERRTQLNVFEF